MKTLATKSSDGRKIRPDGSRIGRDVIRACENMMCLKAFMEPVVKRGGNQLKFCSDECRVEHRRFRERRNYVSGGKKQALRDCKEGWVAEYGGGCSRCGYNKNPAALEFHHRDPSTKRFQLNSGNLYYRSASEVRSELDGCDLLCANCHREEHHDFG